MTPLHAVAIFFAGIAAGAINTVVGSGTLITFPVLLAFGYAPVTANVSNTIGLVPGSITGAAGYRRELTGQAGRSFWLAIPTTSGGIAGAALLLSLSPSAFKAIVPGFIAAALVLIIVQPWIGRRLSARRRRGEHRPGPVANAGVFLSGVYGGYFGAALGILLLGVLGLTIEDDLQRINALKVVLAGIVNVIAGIIFAAVAHVAWGAAGLIAAGSLVGGMIGAHQGRRLHPVALRVVIVVVGVSAIVRLL